MRTTQYLDHGGRITEDWMEDHKKLILKYRSWFTDYGNVNLDITEPGFRKCCAEVEELLSHLARSIWSEKTFDVNVYHNFVKHMYQIVETINTDDEMTMLLSMLEM